MLGARAVTQMQICREFPTFDATPIRGSGVVGAIQLIVCPPKPRVSAQVEDNVVQGGSYDQPRF